MGVHVEWPWTQGLKCGCRWNRQNPGVLAVHRVGGWGWQPCSWGGDTAVSSGRGAAAFPSLGGQYQQWLLVTSVAEAVSFLCRAGCWSPHHHTLQSPLLWAWQGFCSCPEGWWGPQWQWLPGSSAQQAMGTTMAPATWFILIASTLLFCS